MKKKNVEIGYHASQEQFAPSDLVRFAMLAESAGFTLTMSADHLNPWSSAQGHSGFTWSWLGAAMAKTSRMNFGSMAIPCGMRYHPVIVAQAAATLAEMFPGRLKWIAAGSGEALNELVVQPQWPEKKQRNELLKEGIEIIRELWQGNTVTKTNGHHYTKEARIWSLPPEPPAIFGAALSAATARYIAPYTDGLVTVFQSVPQLREMVAAYRDGGGTGKIYIQIHVGWHPDRDIAVASAFDQWRNNLLPAGLSQDLSSVEMFDRAAGNLSMQDVEHMVFIGSDAAYFADLIESCIAAGADGIIFHNTGRNQDAFIEFFGDKVLPHVVSARA